MKYPTRNKELPENLVFDNTGQNDAANFQRTLKGMANFLHTTYCAEVSEAILKMQAVTITVDDLPEQCLPSPGPRLPAPTEQARTLSADPAAQLEATLRRHRWNISAAARELSLSRPTIYRWMKVYNIVLPKAQE